MADDSIKRRFPHYPRPTPEEVERLLQSVSFDDIMRQARAGNLAPLHEYLRAFLPHHHAATIIEFYERRLRHDLIKDLPSPEQEAEAAIATLARYRIKMMRRQLPPGERLPDGTHPRVIDESAAWLAEAGDLGHSDPAEIKFEPIRNKVGRGKRR
jgi:hypothetical protein